MFGALPCSPRVLQGALVGKCRTLDQAKAVVTFLDAASEKTLRSTVALTAARGRGKVGHPSGGGGGIRIFFIFHLVARGPRRCTAATPVALVVW